MKTVLSSTGKPSSLSGEVANKDKLPEPEYSQYEPPVVLVKTWVGLLTSSHDKEVKDRAKEMLINAFGSIKSAAEFCAKNNIPVG